MGTLALVDDDPNLYLRNVWHAPASWSSAPFDIGDTFMLNGDTHCVVIAVDEYGFTFVETS